MPTRAVPCTELAQNTDSYPAALSRFLGPEKPPGLTAFGNVELLRLPLLGILSSIRTPPDLILRSYDLSRKLRQAGIAVVGGFQSPLERECLLLLLRGSQPIVACAARGIEGMRIPRPWRGALRDERMLIVSPFGARRRRPNVRSASVRNRIVAALAERMFVIHARPGSRTFKTAVAALDWGKPVYCFEHRRNRDLILRGAVPVTVKEFLTTLAEDGGD